LGQPIKLNSCLRTRLIQSFRDFELEQAFSICVDETIENHRRGYNRNNTPEDNTIEDNKIENNTIKDNTIKDNTIKDNTIKDTVI